jgi:hypothetical protein
MEVDMKTREFSKAHFIILLGLCLSFLVIVPDKLAWAGENNQTVPTVPTETATLTNTPTVTETATTVVAEAAATADAAASATAEAEASQTATITATSTATATATATLDGTLTNTPFVLPTEIVEDTGAGNLRTYIGIGLVLLLVFGAGIGSLIWRLLRRGGGDEE